jgi:hypothetical protein
MELGAIGGYSVSRINRTALNKTMDSSASFLTLGINILGRLPCIWVGVDWKTCRHLEILLMKAWVARTAPFVFPWRSFVAFLISGESSKTTVPFTLRWNSRSLFGLINKSQSAMKDGGATIIVVLEMHRSISHRDILTHSGRLF